jgi:hypothetical protein
MKFTEVRTIQALEKRIVHTSTCQNCLHFHGVSETPEDT